MSHFETLSYSKTKTVEILYSKKTIFVTEFSCDMIFTEVKVSSPVSRTRPFWKQLESIKN